MEEEFLENEDKPREAKPMSAFVDAGMKAIKARADAYKPRKGIYTELQALVATLRKEYGETAKTGKGSFGFYMGFLKRFSINEVYSMQKFASESKTPVKAFWWLVGKKLKERKVSRETKPSVSQGTSERPD